VLRLSIYTILSFPYWYPAAGHVVFIVFPSHKVYSLWERVNRFLTDIRQLGMSSSSSSRLIKFIVSGRELTVSLLISGSWVCRLRRLPVSSKVYSLWDRVHRFLTDIRQLLMSSSSSSRLIKFIVSGRELTLSLLISGSCVCRLRRLPVSSKVYSLWDRVHLLLLPFTLAVCCLICIKRQNLFITVYFFYFRSTNFLSSVRQ
jgi:hypothetical protein